MLAAVALLILGPLGGVAAAYMNFTARDLRPRADPRRHSSAALSTYPYGAEGRHGANYMQTMAASVASSARWRSSSRPPVWLGMEMPPSGS
jgi:hypothetical protein